MGLDLSLRGLGGDFATLICICIYDTGERDPAKKGGSRRFSGRWCSELSSVAGAADRFDISDVLLMSTQWFQWDSEESSTSNKASLVPPGVTYR